MTLLVSAGSRYDYNSGRLRNGVLFVSAAPQRGWREWRACVRGLRG